MDSRKFKEQLEKCETLEQMFSLCTAKFNLNNKLNFVSKTFIVEGILNGLKMVNPKEK